MGTISPGVKLYIDTVKDSSGETWSEVAELNSVQFPDKSKEVIDMTHLNSTDRYRIFKSGFRDAGRMVANINYTATQYGVLNTEFDLNSNQTSWKIELNDSASSEFICVGILTRLSGTVPEGSGKNTMDIEIKLSGKPGTSPS